LTYHNDNTVYSEQAVTQDSVLVKIYKVFIYRVVRSIQGAQTRITQFYLKITPRLPFVRKRSPDGVTSNRGSRHLVAAYYLFVDPEGTRG